MTQLPRCPVRGCPVRYRGGPDRLCPGHQDDGVHDQAAELGIDLGPRAVWQPRETTKEDPPA